MQNLKDKKCSVTEEEEKPEETTHILEALKASLKVKSKRPTSAIARRKMDMAVSK